MYSNFVICVKQKEGFTSYFCIRGHSFMILGTGGRVRIGEGMKTFQRTVGVMKLSRKFSSMLYEVLYLLLSRT